MKFFEEVVGITIRDPRIKVAIALVVIAFMSGVSAAGYKIALGDHVEATRKTSEIVIKNQGDMETVKTNTAELVRLARLQCLERAKTQVKVLACLDPKIVPGKGDL